MPDKAGRGAAERAADAARIRALEFALRAASPIDPALDLPAKPMFSGASFSITGQRMAAWYDAELTLKLSPEDGARLIETGGRSSGIVERRIEVPEAWLDDPAAFSPWANSALTYTPRR